MFTIVRIGVLAFAVLTSLLVASPASAQATAVAPRYDVYCLEVLPGTVHLPMICVPDPLS